MRSRAIIARCRCVDDLAGQDLRRIRDQALSDLVFLSRRFIVFCLCACVCGCVDVGVYHVCFILWDVCRDEFWFLSLFTFGMV